MVPFARIAMFICVVSQITVIGHILNRKSP